nr:MAG TPA: hypothetical protein [Caudoviricetes sp.]
MTFHRLNIITNSLEPRKGFFFMPKSRKFPCFK